MATTTTIRIRRPSARTCDIPDLLEFVPFLGNLSRTDGKRGENFPGLEADLGGRRF
jgi:hypothetical protein